VYGNIVTTPFDYAGLVNWSPDTQQFIVATSMTGINMAYYSTDYLIAYAILSWVDALGNFHSFDNNSYVFSVGDLPALNQPITFDGSGNTVIQFAMYTAEGNTFSHTLMLHRVTPTTQSFVDTGFDNTRDGYYHTVPGPYTEDVSNATYNQPITASAPNTLAIIYGLESFSFVTQIG